MLVVHWVVTLADWTAGRMVAWMADETAVLKAVQ